MNLILPYFCLCSRPCSPLVLVAQSALYAQALPPHSPRLELLIAQPRGRMKCRNFIWGRVRRSEKIIHKIQTTPHTLSIFTAQLRDCNCTEQRGGLRHCALQHLTGEKKMFYLHSRGVQEKRKALLRSRDFLPQHTSRFYQLQWRMCLVSVCAEVGESWWCPEVAQHKHQTPTHV